MQKVDSVIEKKRPNGQRLKFKPERLHTSRCDELNYHSPEPTLRNCQWIKNDGFLVWWYDFVKSYYVEFFYSVTFPVGLFLVVQYCCVKVFFYYGFAIRFCNIFFFLWDGLFSSYFLWLSELWESFGCDSVKIIQDVDTCVAGLASG